jgi:hypothetical protein
MLSDWESEDHPEGVHIGINSLDQEWTLDRYAETLYDSRLLDADLALAHLEAQKRGAATPIGEKWTLRYHGLQILKEVPRGEMG